MKTGQSIFTQHLPEKKISMLEKIPRCCVEVDECDAVLRKERPCAWSMRYRSVIGFGRHVSSKTGEKEKEFKLHYAPSWKQDKRNINPDRPDIPDAIGKL